MPGNIVPPGGVGSPQHIDLSALRAHYHGMGTKSGHLPAAARLAGGGVALTVDARWIGARFLSNHLPVVLEFTCP